MANRKPNILQEIQSVLNKAAIVYQNRIKFQSPVDTGKLKRSVRVRAFVGTDWESVRFEIDYETYGKYTDLGTGPYYKGEEPQAKWRKSPRKGRGGIRPRYWTNIDKREEQRIVNMLYPEISKAIQEYWNTIQTP
jgi:hypothetical protein